MLFLLESELVFESWGRKAAPVRKNSYMLAGCGMGLKFKTLCWSFGSLCASVT
jgi:hypothetical protein